MKEVGQNIKDKKRYKELGKETCPGEEVVKEEKFPNSRKPSHRRVCGEFWNFRGQHNWEEKNPPQDRRLTATASREVPQMLASTTSEQGLDTGTGSIISP